MPRLALAALALAVGLAALVVVATAGALPATVAAHFDAGGRPDAAMARGNYLALMLALAAGLPALLLASTAWLPRLAIDRVGLPDRAHWLAPARREATLRRLAGLGCGLGVIAAATVAGVHLLIVDAHASAPPRVSTPALAALIAAFVAAETAWIAAFLLRLRRAG
jgi:hypothetical protein